MQMMKRVIFQLIFDNEINRTWSLLIFTTFDVGSYFPHSCETFTWKARSFWCLMKKGLNQGEKEFTFFFFLFSGELLEQRRGGGGYMGKLGQSVVIIQVTIQIKNETKWGTEAGKRVEFRMRWCFREVCLLCFWLHCTWELVTGLSPVWSSENNGNWTVLIKINIFHACMKQHMITPNAPHPHKQSRHRETTYPGSAHNSLVLLDPKIIPMRYITLLLWCQFMGLPANKYNRAGELSMKYLREQW